MNLGFFSQRQRTYATTLAIGIFGFGFLTLGSVRAQAPAAPPVANAPTPANTALTAKSSRPAAPTTATQQAAPATGGPPLNPTIKQQLEAVPALAGAGFNVTDRSKDIVDHLNAALRFYHGAVASVQKVGEPSDVLYQEESASQAMQLTQLAFQGAKNEAVLLDKMRPAQSNAGPEQQNETQRLQMIRQQASNKVEDLQAQDAALSKQIATARPNVLQGLRQQQEEIEGQLQLQKAMAEALAKLGVLADAQTNSGLSGDIQRLQGSAPELTNSNAKPVPPPVLESLSAMHDAGVSSQAVAMFQLFASRNSIDKQLKEVESLRTMVSDLRMPIIQVLRGTIQQGQGLSLASANANGKIAPDPNASETTRKKFESLTSTFETLSNIVLPMSQEIVTLDQERSTLSTWRSAVDDEYKSVLHWLLFRVIAIAGALGVIFLLNQLWGRATVRYVQDLRRRRQLLFVRRTVIALLSCLVLVFGFVTQFSSLATFAGFISAGIAVGLQTILLSVAAYFFIVGRYGVRVGDRITVAGVTGDVIEVGLARFYLTELVGSGTELHPTGRVAVFANSVLFQTGTPLYKQMPGTEYAWHELTVKLNQGVDFQPATQAVLKSVNDLYETYKARIDKQHQQVESWMGTALQHPTVQSRLQLAEGGLQYVVLFPVELQNASDTDEKITKSLIATINKNDQIKAAVASPPVIKAAIKTA